MQVHEAIHARRALRVLDPVSVTDEMIRDLARHASLAPSCYNKQPWRFVFVRSPQKLTELHDAWSKGNEWCRDASLAIAVCTRKENDCVLKDNDPHPERAYAQFDTGLAAAHLMLRATELGLVAHPIAGYSPDKARAILAIPDDYQILNFILVGALAKPGDDHERNEMIEAETERPERKPFEAFASVDTFAIEE